MKRARMAWMVAPVSGVVLAFLGVALAQQIHRDPFEGNEPVWVKGPTDAKVREIAHRITEEHAHGGQRSEFIHVEAETGSFIHYVYEIGRAPIREDLTAGVWVRANRPGVQLLGRLVLPHERNPDRPEEPLTVLLRGDIYQRTSRWEPLQLRHPGKLVTDQQQQLQAQTMRAVDITDAYIDQLVLNLYPGPGETQVWIDDLEVGPLSQPSPFKTTSRPANREATSPDRNPPRRGGMVRIQDERLLVNNRRFFIRGIRYSGTKLETLRDAGFNTLWIDEGTPVDRIEEAVNQGFWLVPSLPSLDDGGPDAAGQNIVQTVSRLAVQDAVLLWDLGGGLTAEQAPRLARVAELVRNTDRDRPLAADVWDGFRPYSRSVQLLGVHRWPLMTGLELLQYREWLNERRLLAQSDGFLWTWIQTHLPDWYTNLVYDRPSAAGFNEPIGPQPEQIRLLTYTALAAGCRGLGFWSDRFLADSHQGRDRLLTLALLNMELQMLEPMLNASDAPSWIDTSERFVKAAVFRSERGILVVPIWVGDSAQLVPGQSAVPRLSIVVPQVPEGLIAHEITPGEVKTLNQQQRVVGGTKITIPEFGLTTAVAFIPSQGQTSLLVYFQGQAMKTRQVAAQWAHDLAQLELAKVTQVNQQLVQAGHPQPDGDKLLQDARARLQRCRHAWDEHEYAEAYHEADRAMRPLRILMRAEWQDACKGLDTPMASPYALSYFTLPRHWRFMDQVRAGHASGNLLPGGDFESLPTTGANAWQPDSRSLDSQYVDLDARLVPEDPHEGRQCLMLEIKAKNTPGQDGKVPPPPAALERTYLALYSPPVRLQPGTLVRISAWIKIPKPITASADGALLYDSAGGEPLALRLTYAVKQWRKVTLYRTVPASGMVNVTLAMTGIGKVYFDDVRVEPLEGQGVPNQPVHQATWRGDGK
jgi:hypothetical protein